MEFLDHFGEKKELDDEFEIRLNFKSGQTLVDAFCWSLLQNFVLVQIQNIFNL